MQPAKRRLSRATNWMQSSPVRVGGPAGAALDPLIIGNHCSCWPAAASNGLQGDELRLIRALLRKNPNSSFLFMSERKAPLSIDGAQRLIERLGVAAGLAFPIHPHMLRHSAGYALAGRGVDTRTLQAFMGHRTISSTVIYTAVADKRVRNIWGK